MKAINLGSSMADHRMAEGEGDPRNSMPMEMGGEKGTKYPEFHYAGKEDLDLPDEGEITLKYKKTQEKRLVVNGTHYYECCLELHKMTDKPEEGSPTAPANSYDEAGESLDKIRAEMEKENSEEDEEEEEHSDNPGY